MRYRLAESQIHPGEWHVEATDRDGHVMTATFSGPGAEGRARAYIAWIIKAGGVPTYDR